MSFRLIPKSVTLNDLERRNGPYTVAQIAQRFEPSIVLWAFHTIQPSSFQCTVLRACKKHFQNYISVLFIYPSQYFSRKCNDDTAILSLGLTIVTCILSNCTFLTTLNNSNLVTVIQGLQKWYSATSRSHRIFQYLFSFSCFRKNEPEAFKFYASFDRGNLQRRDITHLYSPKNGST